MTNTHTDLSTLDPTLLAAKSGRRRKRFLALSVAALAVLAVSMGVSFLGTTGTSGIKVTASSSNYVFPVAASGIANEPKAAGELKWGSKKEEATKKEGKLPGWSPTENAAGEVTESGDLALIDATATALVANVFITNLATLQGGYTSFALPVKVYEAKIVTTEGSEKCTATVPCKAADWSQVSTSEISEVFLTNTEGNLSFNLKANTYYDIAIEKGGSYYTISTATAADLEPSFYFTAQAT